MEKTTQCNNNLLFCSSNSHTYASSLANSVALISVYCLNDNIMMCLFFMYILSLKSVHAMQYYTISNSITFIIFLYIPLDVQKTAFYESNKKKLVLLFSPTQLNSYYPLLQSQLPTPNPILYLQPFQSSSSHACPSIYVPFYFQSKTDCIHISHSAISADDSARHIRVSGQCGSRFCLYFSQLLQKLKKLKIVLSRHHHYPINCFRFLNLVFDQESNSFSLAMQCATSQFQLWHMRFYLHQIAFSCCF